MIADFVLAFFIGAAAGIFIHWFLSRGDLQYLEKSLHCAEGARTRYYDFWRDEIAKANEADVRIRRLKDAVQTHCEKTPTICASALDVEMWAQANAIPYPLAPEESHETRSLDSVPGPGPGLF